MLAGGRRANGVKLVRIDDRLIHGQVVVRWLRHIGCREILIVDDELSCDEYMQKVLRLAAPAGVRVSILSVAEAAARLRARALCLSGNHLRAGPSPVCDGVSGEGCTSDWRNCSADAILVLLRSPDAALELLDQGFFFEELNVGGLAASEGTFRLYKSVSASVQQIETLQSIQRRGVRVYFQTVPDDRPAELKDLIPIRRGP